MKLAILKEGEWLVAMVNLFLTGRPQVVFVEG